MKYLQSYLKRFNESVDESNIEEIKQTIKDILLPISDMGYDISVTGDNENLVIRVVSWGDQSLLITDEVKEEFIRMKDYLQSEGYDSIIVSFLKCHSLKDKTEDEIRLIRLSGKHIQSIEEKEFDDFINTDINYPIEKLRFVAKKIL